MKSTIGLAMVIVGLMMTVYTGFNYITRESLVDFGSYALTKESDQKVFWEPYVGIGVMVVGGLMVRLDKTRTLAHS